jgi:uncharacterized protein YdiU (UPF0061 family)
MAMVLQANRVPSSNSSTVAMDSYKQLQQSTDQEDSFHRKIFDKIDEGKRDRDPQKCQQILNDLMTMLKHLTADVNNYNLAFRETRPPFYMQVRNTDILMNNNDNLFFYKGISTFNRSYRNINKSP